jgi:hypothetical protein
MLKSIPDEIVKDFYRDLPDLAPITEKTRAENTKRIFTGGVRINRGMYRTTKDEYARRDKILSKQLP